MHVLGDVDELEVKCECARRLEGHRRRKFGANPIEFRPCIFAGLVAACFARIFRGLAHGFDDLEEGFALVCAKHAPERVADAMDIVRKLSFHGQELLPRKPAAVDSLAPFDVHSSHA